MKATELMIGDWVYSASMTPRKVQYLNYAKSDSIGVADHLNFESNISPIPITPEILEENGWKETEYWHEYKDGKSIIQCCLPDMRGKINGIEIEHVKCEYVHQYQHLLRLCGLDELADNFKV